MMPGPLRKKGENLILTTARVRWLSTSARWWLWQPELRGRLLALYGALRVPIYTFIGMTSEIHHQLGVSDRVKVCYVTV